MIDHLSLAVRDLAASDRFFAAVLAPLGYRRLVSRPETVGFGTSYLEILLNARPDMPPAAKDGGWHVCLRARDERAVRAFHAAASRRAGPTTGHRAPEPASRRAIMPPSSSTQTATSSKRGVFRGRSERRPHNHRRCFPLPCCTSAAMRNQNQSVAR